MDGLSEYLGYFEAAPSTQPSQSGLTKMSIKTLQTVLIKLGEKVTADGLYGPNTRGAWQRQATKRKLNPAFDRAARDQAWIAMPTYVALSNAAYPTTKAAPAPAPTPRPASISTIGLIGQTVQRTQELLQALGVAVVVDGLYGPKTKSAWESAAKRRGMPEAYVRVDGKNVAVAPDTLKKFETEVASRKAVRAPKPTAPKPATPPAPATVGMTRLSVAQTQAILHELGVARTPATSDGLYGPTTAREWASQASKHKVPTAYVRIDGKTVAVDPVTVKKFGQVIAARKAAAKPAPAPAPKSPTVASVVKSVTELQSLLHAVGVAKTKATSDGLFGPATTREWQRAASARKVPTLFQRVTGTTARVAVAAYDRIKADGARRPAPPKPVPKPAPPPTKPSKPAIATVVKSVAETQAIMHALGLKKEKATTDGLYGPKTTTAWVQQAASRKLPTLYERMTGTTVRVAQVTYDALKSAATSAVKSGTTPPPPAPPKPMAPTATLTAKKVQQGLNAYLRTKTLPFPLLDTDGIWGAKTEQALQAWLRTRPGGEQAIPKVAVRGNNVTMPSAFAQTLAEAAKTAPAPPPRVDIAVSVVKLALKNLGRSVGAGATLDATTRASLVQFIKQEDFIDTGFKVSKDGKTVLRIRKNVVDKLRSAAEPKGLPSPAPKPTTPAPAPAPQPPDLIQATVDKMLPQFKTPVAVLDLQKFFSAARPDLGAGPVLPLDQMFSRPGTWDDKTANAFIAAFKIPESVQPILYALFPKVLSADRKTIRLTDAGAASVKQGVIAYDVAMKAAAPPPAPPESEPLPAPAPLPPSAPEPLPPVALGPGIEPPLPPAPAPAPTSEPTPPIVSPAAIAAGARAWQAGVSALTDFATMAPVYAKAIEEAGPLNPEAQAAVEAWISSAEKLKQRFVAIIENTPDLQAAIDAAGQGTAVAGFESGLAAYFADFASASQDALNLLRTPLTVSLSGFAGFGQAQAVLPWVSRLAGPAWKALMELLGSRAVATIGAAVVGADALTDIMTGETEEYLESNRRLAELVAEGKLTAEEAQKLKEKPPAGGAAGGLILGAVALGAMGLYFMSKK